MNVIVLRQASDEFEDAVAYYEEQETGLGKRLRHEVDLHVRWIVRQSQLPRVRPGGYRRVNLKVFPYYIAYIVRGNVIWIVAIANAYKRPNYWIDRLGK